MDQREAGVWEVIIMKEGKEQTEHYVYGIYSIETQYWNH